LGTSSRGEARVAVRVNPVIWREEVERLNARSPARIAAERELRHLRHDGVPEGELMRCADSGSDGTRLGGVLKVYVPIADSPASARPYGFVLSGGRDHEGEYVELVAYGHRHPPRGTRSVYERAHKRLHGRYPDQ
jgi:hypothetical protein